VLTRPFGAAGVPVSVISQGTRHAAEDRRLKIVAAVLAGQRDRVIIATNLLPSNASSKSAPAAEDVSAIDAERRR